MGLNENVQNIVTKIEATMAAQDTSIDAITAAIKAALYPHKIPAGTTTFSAVNAADITTTTAIAIKAGTAAKQIYITQALAMNKTTTEDNAYYLESSETTPTVYAVIPGQDVDAVTAPLQFINFNPPIKCVAGKGVNGKGVIASVGDTRIMINGYIET